MGCNSSKAASATSPAAVTKEKPTPNVPAKETRSNSSSSSTNDKVYKLLVKAQSQPLLFLPQIHLPVSASAASYQSANTRSTPLHMAVRLLDSFDSNDDDDDDNTNQQENLLRLVKIVQSLLQVYPHASQTRDAAARIPLHYAMAPSVTQPPSLWNTRTAVIRMLLSATDTDTVQEYLARNNVVFDEQVSPPERVSPLYRAVQAFPDDFHTASPTVAFLAAVTAYCGDLNRTNPVNESDGDTPLALLYRRFTRQFDQAEQFFDGDNSRPQVLLHRNQYKTAAGNTWKCIELVLQTNKERKLVHRAARVPHIPPDLVRYIVETNAPDLVVTDAQGNLPLHYAAAAPGEAYSTKYVVDELLYKFPEAARIKNADGLYPLAVAVQAGKQWIAGGIKSLYDAYPEAIEQVDLEQYPALQKALSADLQDREDGSESQADEHHDAIMLVQTNGVKVHQVVTSMWAHEEDAGVQMLGCVALTKLVKNTETAQRIALSAVAAIVNAMKAHPNEVVVQEKACRALYSLAQADGYREVSLVASGAVAAIVGAMQAHINDAGVQEEACRALAEIIRCGGADRATVVASVSGLTALYNALSAHPHVAGVQIHSCHALCELLSYPKANLGSLDISQTEPLLEAARSNFEECASDVELILSKLK